MTQWERVEKVRGIVKSLESMLVVVQSKPAAYNASSMDRRVLADALMGLMQASVSLHTLLYTTDLGNAMRREQ
jgi:hypothetical protein